MRYATKRIVVSSLISILVCTLLAGCLTEEESSTDFEEAPLFGMVYDFRGQPTSGATVIIDSATKTQTDINGRFVIHQLSKGRHRLSLTKDGFEPLTIEFAFIDRNQVLYLRAVSLEQLLEQTEQALEQKDYPAAERLIQRAQVVDATNPVRLYLKAIYFAGKEEYGQAVAVLQQLLNARFTDPSVYLFLADIHQYSLDDRESAKQYLGIYLESYEDADVKQRLSELELEPGNPDAANTTESGSE